MGGRVHSIDVILGFSKDQDPLLSPSGGPGLHKVGVDGLGDPGKQDPAHPYGHLSEQQSYHGESLRCEINTPLGIL